MLFWSGNTVLSESRRYPKVLVKNYSVWKIQPIQKNANQWALNLSFLSILSPLTSTLYFPSPKSQLLKTYLVESQAAYNKEKPNYCWESDGFF